MHDYIKKSLACITSFIHTKMSIGGWCRSWMLSGKVGPGSHFTVSYVVANKEKNTDVSYKIVASENRIAPGIV